MKTYLHPEFRALQRARDEGLDLAEAWNAFATKARAKADNPPHIVRDVVEQVQAQQGDRAPEEITILDHGCGAAFALLYLLALGYTEVYGVNIESNSENPMWNGLCKDVLGLLGTRFHFYDGSRLPFEDSFFDVVFSNQVVEHVEDHLWDSFFAEEARVLKPGGRVFHEVPHRLAPYESHTRTWFLHYLPRPIHRRLYQASGRGAFDAHILRLPSTTARAIHRYIGPTQDYTMYSFLRNVGPESFDGPRQRRQLMHGACSLPILGHLAQLLLRPLIMLRIGATKVAGMNEQRAI